MKGQWAEENRRQVIAFAATYFAAGALALVAAALFILAFGGNVLVAMETVLRASLGTWGGTAQTLNKFCPLLLGSLAVAFGLRGGHFNIGVDGQIYAGAIALTGVAFGLQGLNLPWPIFVPVALLGGILGGALRGLIPGFLRVRYQVSEIFVTVMLNFVALYLWTIWPTAPGTIPSLEKPSPSPSPRRRCCLNCSPNPGDTRARSSRSRWPWGCIS